MGAFLHELFQFNLYKRTQGRVVRQVTFAACAVVVALGCYSLSFQLGGTKNEAVRYGVPLVLLAAGGWACFRLIHMPQFADFLISVEAEMNKVAWPKRTELINASIVVMVVIFALAGLLFGFDFVLQSIPRLFKMLVNTLAGGGDAEVEVPVE